MRLRRRTSRARTREGINPAAPSTRSRTRTPRPQPVHLDELPPIDLGDRRGLRLPPTGICHGCDTPVTGDRRYCGPCLADPTRRHTTQEGNSA